MKYEVLYVLEQKGMKYYYLSRRERCFGWRALTFNGKYPKGIKFYEVRYDSVYPVKNF